MLLAESITITGKTVFDYLDMEAEVPQIDTAGAQGDVLILRVTTTPASKPLPKTLVVVASEASSNTHTLHPNGECYFDAHTARTAGDVLLGTLTVPGGSTALLSHPEHGNIEILPGTYGVRRQREYGAEWSYVAD